MVIVQINAKMCLLRFFSTIGIFSVWNFLSPRHQAAVWWKAIAHISMKRRLKVNGKFLASTTTLSIIFSKQRKKYICIYILYFNLKYFSLVIDFYSSIRLLKSQSSCLKSFLGLLPEMVIHCHHYHHVFTHDPILSSQHLKEFSKWYHLF